MAKRAKNSDVESVYVLIRRLQSLALEFDNENLGKFHRELAIELGKDEPEGNTEASKLARELLKDAKERLQKFRERGTLGADKRWHPEKYKETTEPTEPTEPTEETPF